MGWSPTQNSTYNALRTARSLAKGRNYREGRAYRLDEVIEGPDSGGPGLRQLSRGAGLRPNSPSSFMRAARMLGELRVEEGYRTLQEEGVVRRVPPEMGENYLKLMRVVDKAMKDDDATARLHRRLITRAASGAKGFSVFRQGKRPGEPEALAPAQPEGSIPPEEAAVNDMQDVLTAALLYRKAQDIPGVRENPEQVGQRLFEIARTITEFDNRQLEAREQREEKATALRTFTSKEEALSDVRAEVRAWYQALDDAYKPWAETYMLGSLYPQEKGLSAYQKIGQKRNELRALKEQDAPPEEIGPVQNQLRQLIKEWYNTQRASTFWTNADFIPPTRVAEFFRAYDEFVQVTHRDNLSEEDIRTILRDSPLGGGRVLKAVTGRESADQMQADVRAREKVDRFGERFQRLSEMDAEFLQREEWQRLGDRLEAVLKEHSWVIEKGVEETFAGLVAMTGARSPGKTPRTATKRDLRQVIAKLEQMSERRDHGKRRLQWTDWFKWWQGIDKEQRPWDPDIQDVENFPVLAVINNDPQINRAIEGVATVEGTVKLPFSQMGKQHRVTRLINEYQDSQEAEEIEDLDRRVRFLEAIEDGDELRELAVMIREGRAEGASPNKKRQAREARNRLNDEFSGRVYEVKGPGEETKQSRTAKEIVDLFNSEVTKWAEEQHSKRIHNEAADEQWLAPYRDQSVEGPEGNGRLDTRRMANDLVDALIREQGFFSGSIEELPPIETIRKMNRQSMLNKTEVQMPRFDEETWGRLQRYFAQEGRPISSMAGLRQTQEFQAVLNRDTEAMDRMPDALVRDLKAGLEDGATKKLRDVDDPLRSKIEQQLVREHKAFQVDPFRAEDANFESYWPRNGWSSVALKQLKQRRMEEARAEGKDPDALRREELSIEAEIGKLMGEDKALTADYAEAMAKATITKDDIESPHWGFTPGHLMRRGRHTETGEPLEGYDRTTQALQTYQNQMLAGQSNLFGSFLRSELTRQFEDEGRMGEFTEQWAAFMRAYNRDLMGGPGVFPPEWSEAVGGRVGPYFAFTDNPLREKADAIMNRMGFSGSFFSTDGGDGTRRAKNAERLQRFSKLEGQWNLLTLLAHTKSMANNLFGGSKNTAVNAGFRNLSTALRRDVKEFRRRVDPDIDSKEDLRRKAERAGATENFIVNEIRNHDWNARVQDISEKFDIGVDDINAIVEKIKKNPDVSDEQVKRDLATRIQQSDTVGEALEESIERAKEKTMSPKARAQAEALWEEMVEQGGWFMRRSERKLRTDAWWAHHLQAQDMLWANGSTFEWDHPWLVDMANRGTEATQFLYNNAERPAFARTAIGRVFSRFQMYTWNAIRFRKKLAAQANEVGFDPGSREFNRLARMLQADLFIMGLASLVPWSLFGNSVPSPFSEVKELATLMFGDDEQKEEAFYGTDWGPLNDAKFLKLVAPPSSRVPEALFTTMLTQDWQRFAGYSIHQWYPFGRLTRDAFLAVRRPSTLPERLFGVPTTTAERAQDQIGGGTPLSRSAENIGEAIDVTALFETNGEPATAQQLQTRIE